VAQISKHRISRGFTLIELLIVIALLGMLFTALFGTYLGIQKSISRAGKDSNERHKAESALSSAIRDFVNASFDNYSKEILFEGKKEIPGQSRCDSVAFNTGRYYSSGSVLASSIFSVRYFCKMDSTGRTILYRAAAPYALNSKMSASLEIFAVPIIAVEEWALSYSSDGSSFTDEWTQSATGKIPKVISITMAWLDSDGNRREITTRVQPVRMSFR